jgi:hypothetical protein
VAKSDDADMHSMVPASCCPRERRGRVAYALASYLHDAPPRGSAEVEQIERRKLLGEHALLNLDGGTIGALVGQTGELLHGPLSWLYDVLARFAPGTVVLVARGVALAENGEADAALSQLDAISGADGYRPWWASRARILWLCGQEAAARGAASRAAGLSSDPGIRHVLL